MELPKGKLYPCSQILDLTPAHTLAYITAVKSFIIHALDNKAIYFTTAGHISAGTGFKIRHWLTIRVTEKIFPDFGNFLKQISGNFERDFATYSNSC